VAPSKSNPAKRFAHLVEVVQVAHLARRDGGEGDERDGGAKRRGGHFEIAPKLELVRARVRREDGNGYKRVRADLCRTGLATKRQSRNAIGGESRRCKLETGATSLNAILNPNPREASVSSTEAAMNVLLAFGFSYISFFVTVRCQLPCRQSLGRATGQRWLGRGADDRTGPGCTDARPAPALWSARAAGRW
jgi:hypothetical protein